MARVDPGSAGSIPYSGHGNPGGVGGVPVQGFVVTVGLLLDSSTSAIPSTLVIAQSYDGTPIAGAITNDSGAFALNLPKIPGLTLVVPALGVYDVPVTAGDPLLVIVP